MSFLAGRVAIFECDIVGGVVRDYDLVVNLKITKFVSLHVFW